MRLFTLIAVSMWDRAVSVQLAVFDLSNLFIGAHGKIDVRKAYGFITRHRPVDKTVYIGSASSKQTAEGLDETMKSIGKEVDGTIQVRVPGEGEQLVDTTIAAHIMHTVLSHHTSGKPPGCIILVSGDGKCSDTVSIFSAVEQAAKLGWEIEINSWEHCLSRNYRELCRMYPLVRVLLLDPYRDAMTSTKTRLCKFWIGGTPCPHKSCDFAHGYHELLRSQCAPVLPLARIARPQICWGK